MSPLEGPRSHKRLTSLIRPMDTEGAACFDHPTLPADAWFPDTIRDPLIDEASAVCGGCPIQARCAAFAEEVGARYGIWGGVLHHGWRRP